MASILGVHTKHRIQNSWKPKMKIYLLLPANNWQSTRSRGAVLVLYLGVIPCRNWWICWSISWPITIWYFKNQPGPSYESYEMAWRGVEFPINLFLFKHFLLIFYTSLFCIFNWCKKNFRKGSQVKWDRHKKEMWKNKRILYW